MTQPASDSGSSGGGSSSLAKQFTKGKIGGVPTWGVAVLFAALFVGILWYRNRNKAATPTTAPTDTTAPPLDNTGGQASTDPIQAWLAQNPTSSAYPVGNTAGLGASTPITNDQWARLVIDELLAKGNDPTLVENAIAHYLQGATLTDAERAVVNLALQLQGSPPEGTLPVNTTGGGTGGGTPTPSGPLLIAKRKDNPGNTGPIRMKITSDGGWHQVATDHYTWDTTSVPLWRVGDSLAHYNGQSGLSNPKGQTVILPFNLYQL